MPYQDKPAFGIVCYLNIQRILQPTFRLHVILHGPLGAVHHKCISLGYCTLNKIIPVNMYSVEGGTYRATKQDVAEAGYHYPYRQ